MSALARVTRSARPGRCAEPARSARSATPVRSTQPGRFSRLAAPASALAAIAVAAAGCSGTDAPAPGTDAGGASTQVTLTDAAPGPPVPPTTSPAMVSSGGVSSDAASSGGVSSGGVSSGAGTGADAATTGEGEAPGGARTAAVAQSPAGHGGAGPVDAEDFRVGDGYYFLSPDGGAYCAILGDGSAGNYSAGCQSEFVPPELPECEGGPTGNGAVWLGAGGATGLECFNQGIFVSQPTSEGHNVLEPGRTIEVRGYTCSSSGSTVTCRSDAAGTEFTASGSILMLL